MKMELLLEKRGARFYKLDKFVTKYKNNNLLDGGETNLIIVSDANYHDERLVFALYLKDGFTIDDIKENVSGCLKIDYFHVAGEMTMTINGGDITTVKPDLEYYNDLI